ncbi:hypothetical protein OIV83_005254 [Microbotryomycetes sp. JL201]|nr:hypothetical protein OIV83_005254 [Microbotryomycetes sp. JL201]
MAATVALAPAPLSTSAPDPQPVAAPANSLSVDIAKAQQIAEALRAEPAQELPPNVYFDTPGTARALLKARYKEPISARARSSTPTRSSFVDDDKSDLPWLIAEYGHASTTSWLEKRYKIWRGTSTPEKPRIQGYLESGSFVFAWSNPICLETIEEMQATADEMYAWAKKAHKHLVWCCITDDFAHVLADGVGPKRKGWSVLSCIREDMIDVQSVNLNNKDVKHNLRRAEKANLRIEELIIEGPDFEPDPRDKKQIEEGIAGWKANRHGRQIASASLLPWLDVSNRRYFVARTSEGIVALTILSPTSHDTYQIKNSIHFPNSPRGTSEALLAHVIKQMKEEGHSGLSFGASAEKELHLEANLHGWSIKMLSKGYSQIIKRTGLAKRGEFRAKFMASTHSGSGRTSPTSVASPASKVSAVSSPMTTSSSAPSSPTSSHSSQHSASTEHLLHIAFPQHGMGWAGLVALMSVLKA